MQICEQWKSEIENSTLPLGRPSIEKYNIYDDMKVILRIDCELGKLKKLFKETKNIKKNKL